MIYAGNNVYKIVSRMTAFWWDPNNRNLCQATLFAQDSYADYDPKSTALKIYVNNAMKTCESNCNFVRGIFAPLVHHSATRSPIQGPEAV